MTKIRKSFTVHEKQLQKGQFDEIYVPAAIFGQIAKNRPPTHFPAKTRILIAE
jgi:hypothetical protein